MPLSRYLHQLWLWPLWFVHQSRPFPSLSYFLSFIVLLAVSGALKGKRCCEALLNLASPFSYYPCEVCVLDGNCQELASIFVYIKQFLSVAQYLLYVWLLLLLLLLLFLLSLSLSLSSRPRPLFLHFCIYLLILHFHPTGLSMALVGQFMSSKTPFIFSCGFIYLMY